MVITHKSLLAKYILHVRDCEGVDFIDSIGHSDVKFSLAEVAELKRLCEESVTTETKPARVIVYASFKMGDVPQIRVSHFMPSLDGHAVTVRLPNGQVLNFVDTGYRVDYDGTHWFWQIADDTPESIAEKTEDILYVIKQSCLDAETAAEKTRIAVALQRVYNAPNLSAKGRHKDDSLHD